MSSLPRRIARKRKRLTGDWPARERPFRSEGEGGYSTLHPTKGWMRVSAKRLFAQNRLRWHVETGRWEFGKFG